MISKLGIDPEILILVLLALVLILCVTVVIMALKMNDLSHRYDEFLKGKDGVTLEDTVVEAYRQIDMLNEFDQERHEENVKVLDSMKHTFQKIGLVKYDAFKEMGGKLSFSLALLDASDTGFILSVMHSSEACYTYIKEIIEGESYTTLGEEEKEALEKAMYEERE